jgi:hypothetical protein
VTFFTIGSQGTLPMYIWAQTASGVKPTECPRHPADSRVGRASALPPGTAPPQGVTIQRRRAEGCAESSVLKQSPLW